MFSTLALWVQRLVNHFAGTDSVFAKADYTFGDDVQGVGGKGGVRIAGWACRDSAA